jgi:hypothetical protein
VGRGRSRAGAISALAAAPRRPFFLVVYDVAAHHPFDYPEASPTDGDYQRYLHAVRYGDEALRAVYEALAQEGHAQDTSSSSSAITARTSPPR